MAVGAPQGATSRQTEALGPDQSSKDKGCKDCKGEEGEDSVIVAKKSNVLKSAAPPPEDRLAYYIFTTYHLLLKEIRNEANGTEIVAQRDASTAGGKGTGNCLFDTCS